MNLTLCADHSEAKDALNGSLCRSFLQESDSGDSYRGEQRSKHWDTNGRELEEALHRKLSSACRCKRRTYQTGDTHFARAALDVYLASADFQLSGNRGI
jgi:hypothetical protein